MWFIFSVVLFFIFLVFLVSDNKKPRGFPPDVVVLHCKAPPPAALYSTVDSPFALRLQGVRRYVLSLRQKPQPLRKNAGSEEKEKKERHEEGPSWIPVVGCHFEISLLTKKLGFHHLVLEELNKKFGPVVGLRLGRDRIILISGQAAVKRALVKEEFDARPDGFFFRMRSYNKRLGIVFVEGNHFQEQKKFCMTALKKLGMGKKAMEDIIIKEAEELVKSIKEQCQTYNVFQIHNMFDIAVLNSLWALMAGKRFSLNDQKLGHLMELVHEAFRLLDMSGGVLNQMPFLRFVAPNATGFTRIRFVLDNLEAFLESTVLEHKKNLSGEPKDLIDLFLAEMNSRLGQGKGSSFDDQQLIILLLDLFMAGSETTSNNLGMAMLYMITHPWIQEKVQKTIDEVIPEDRLPTLQDRARLRYVEAVIMEVQRHATVVPIAVAHRSTKNAVFEGYVIPKDATILINLRSVLMDKEKWGDPQVFRPERFLDSNGQIVQDEWFIPFGLGKRRCLGEGLARSSMFLLFSAVLQNFQITGVDLPSLTPQDGVTLSPPPFKAILKPRIRSKGIASHSE